MKLDLTYVVGNRRKKAKVTIKKDGNRLVFTRMHPFEFKDELKAMRGCKFDWDNKQWSIEDCYRNHFQLQAMMGEPVYEPWEKPIEHFEPNRDASWGPDWYKGPFKHQQEIIDFTLTRRYCNLAVDMGLGKTFSMIEVMEQSGIKDWWWCAPKSGMKSLKRELNRWGLAEDINLTCYQYNQITDVVKSWRDQGKNFPQGVIFDESSRLANPSSDRSRSAQAIADNIRYKYGWDGMVVTMSGTTQAETPLNIWNQIEITWPGFLREGDRKSLEFRLQLNKAMENANGDRYFEKVTMWDDENKCKTCGLYEYEHPTECGCKKWKKSVNEVALLAERLDGIQLVQKKENCIDLPPKRYREVVVKPSNSTLRAAKAMAAAAPSTMTGINWLRQLSDGFAYKPTKGKIIKCARCDGTGEAVTFKGEKKANQAKVDYAESVEQCPACNGSGVKAKNDRGVVQVPCPKDDALRELLAENYEVGRICIFASYHGSVDRCIKVCHSEGWDVVQVDGRKWAINKVGATRSNCKDDPLDFWADMTNPRVAFVAHPKSGGMGLTLTEARMAVYYSNPYAAEDRLQSEDRVHRIGCDPNHGVTIVDIIHLESDRAIKEALLRKEKLEEMSLGLINFGEENAD